MKLRMDVMTGGKARIKATGQLVDVKRWSTHGIAVIELGSGCEYILPVHKLIPVANAA